MIELFANKGDPDQTTHSVASALFASYPFRSLQTTMGYENIWEDDPKH